MVINDGVQPGARLRLRIGKVTGRQGGGSPRLVLDKFGGLGHNLMLARENPNDAGDDLVRILMKLTSDVERFDSMVVHQRKMARDSEQSSLRAAERLNLEAAEMVACARDALAQLRRVSETRNARVSA
jgi:hypothetical protein